MTACYLVDLAELLNFRGRTLKNRHESQPLTSSSIVEDRIILLLYTLHMHYRTSRVSGCTRWEYSSYGEVWAGVTYTVPRRATINAPPPMGPLGGLMRGPVASFSKYPRGGTIPKGGLTSSDLRSLTAVAMGRLWAKGGGKR